MEAYLKMTDQLTTLLQCPLFEGIKPEDLPHLLKCLMAYETPLETGELLFTLGDEVNTIGIVLTGSMELVKENIAGNRTIVAFLSPSQLFGEGIVCTSKRIAPVTARARTATTLLRIPYKHVIQSCGNACHFHIQLVHNMLRLLGDKNDVLNTKIDLLMLKGIQEKLITYLLSEAKRHQSNAFTILPNRNELADYLNVSRTSMCRELATLKADGLLDYYKNSFKLLDCQALREKLL